MSAKWLSSLLCLVLVVLHTPAKSVLASSSFTNASPAIESQEARFPQAADSSLTWHTFLGSGSNGIPTDAVVDANGDIFVAGSSNVSWGSPVRPYSEFDDGFVAKLDQNGNVLWNTFLGGSGQNDYSVAVALDPQGDVYIAGHGDGTGWGTPIRPATPGADSFVAKVNGANGSLIWNTFLGGIGLDQATSISVDENSNVFVSGSSYWDWGTPLLPHNSNSGDAFIARLDTNGALIWNTFLGSDAVDYSNGISAESGGDLFISGFSTASWGSPIRAYTGNRDAFIAKVGKDGTLLWNTFLGAGNMDEGWGIAADNHGNVVSVGMSYAEWGTPVRAFNPSATENAFVAKVDGNGNLLWNTFLGGPIGDQAMAINISDNGNLYITGVSNFTWGAPEQAYTGNGDVFIAKLANTGDLLWNTFLGGVGSDFGQGLALDQDGNTFVTGTSYVTWGTPLLPFSGNKAFFIAKLAKPPTFSDVSFSYWAYSFVERLYNSGITSGCTTTPLTYCPENNVTRGQMAVFLEKGLHGSSFIPPNLLPSFNDTTGHFAEDWIEALKNDGITSGCAAGLYCPESSVTRAQMAVFLLKSTHGASYSPPPATGTFSDVSTDYWAAAWIEQLASEGITSGCGAGIYCPESPVTRAQMAVFLVKAFSLP